MSRDYAVLFVILSGARRSLESALPQHAHRRLGVDLGNRYPRLRLVPAPRARGDREGDHDRVGGAARSSGDDGGV